RPVSMSESLYKFPTTTPSHHPFPTRRSSDLDEPLHALHECRKALHRLRPDALHREKRNEPYHRAHLHRHRAAVEMKVRSMVGLIDRKSTRLNSSHQIISYAVFCLKKKRTVRY